MKLTLLVEVELNDEEFASLNVKRAKMGLQAHTPAGWIEDNIHHGLTQKGIDRINIFIIKESE